MQPRYEAKRALTAGAINCGSALYMVRCLWYKPPVLALRLLIRRQVMTPQIILITIAGSALLGTVGSAVRNSVQGDDVGKSAKGGLAGGIATGVLGCLLAQLLGVAL